MLGLHWLPFGADTRCLHQISGARCANTEPLVVTPGWRPSRLNSATLAQSALAVNASSFFGPRRAMFMGNELTIDCPHCGEGFELTEALAGPLLEAERKQARIQALKAVDAERTAIAETVRGEVVNEYAAEIRARDAVIADRDAKVKVAQEAELAARKAKEEAELAKQRIELDVQRRVDAIRNDVAAEAAAKATEEVSAKLSLAEATIADKDARLRVAQQAELAARKAKEEAEQARQETEV